MEMDSKVTDPKSIITESDDTYFTDMYTAGETKEQLVVGQEVQAVVPKTGTIDTADTSLQTVNNVYTLNVPDPREEIFSISIDGVNCVIKVDDFATAALAYSDLETQLQSKLGEQYIIDYASGTTFNITRLDGQIITKTSPNLVRNIQLNEWGENYLFDITVDGITVQLDGSVYPSDTAALNYFVTQLPSDYLTEVNGSRVVIARVDGEIPVVTSQAYDRYNYELRYLFGDTSSSGEFIDYVDTTIDGVLYRYDKPSNSRLYPGIEVLKLLSGVKSTTRTSFSSNSDYIGWVGLRFLNKTAGAKVTSVEYRDLDITDSRLTSLDGTVLETKTSDFSSGFNYVMSANTEYRIEYRSTIDTLRTSVTTFGDGNADNDIFQLRGTSQNGTGGSTTLNTNSIGIDSLEIDGDLFPDYITSFNINGDPGDFNTYSKMSIRNTDFSTISLSILNTYTNPGFFPSDSAYTSINIYDNNASITVTTYTEISITLTNTGFNYFIPTFNYPSTITIKATSSLGDSEGTYKVREQSCVAKYSSNTFEVADKVFKTSSGNFGEIVLIKRGGFVITWTTTVSNKLSWTTQ